MTFKLINSISRDETALFPAGCLKCDLLIIYQIWKQKFLPGYLTQSGWKKKRKKGLSLQKQGEMRVGGHGAGMIQQPSDCFGFQPGDLSLGVRLRNIRFHPNASGIARG